MAYILPQVRRSLNVRVISKVRLPILVLLFSACLTAPSPVAATVSNPARTPQHSEHSAADYLPRPTATNAPSRSNSAPTALASSAPAHRFARLPQGLTASPCPREPGQYARRSRRLRALQFQPAARARGRLRRWFHERPEHGEHAKPGPASVRPTGVRNAALSGTPPRSS